MNTKIECLTLANRQDRSFLKKKSAWLSSIAITLLLFLFLLLGAQTALAQCPTQFTVGGGGAYCAGGTGVTITLSGSNNATYTYQLKNGVTNVGTPIAGTGSNLSWPNITAAGTYTVSASDAGATCTVTMTGSAVVTVNALPVPTFTTGATAACVASTGNVYTTEASMTNYVWVVSAGGTITAGGTTTSNTATVTWNTAGAQTVSVRYTNAAGCVGVTPTVRNVTVNALPVPTFTTGATAACVASAGNVYTTEASMTNYVWVVSAGGTITAGGTTTSNTATITWNTAGAQTVSVRYTNASGCVGVTPTVRSVTVNALPVPTFTTGATAACVASTGNVYTTEASMTNYVWVVSAGGTITAGGTTTSNTATITWNTAGAQTVSVRYTNASGCVGVTPTVRSVTVNALPVPTFTTGATAACVASTGNVYTTEASMTNYVWVVSAGGTITAGGTTTSNTATVTWNTAGAQTVSVRYTNASGCVAAAPTVRNVTVNALPVPTFTTGVTSACVASTGNVYTTEAGMTSYVWAITGGTITAGGTTTSNTATVTWNTAGAQTVSIRYTNAGGCVGVTPTVRNVTVNPLPVPTLIGPLLPTIGSSGNVYTTEASMANYIWVVSAGGTITTGGTTTSNTTTVTWNTAGAQTVSIRYTNINSCANATATVANVVVGAVAAAATYPLVWTDLVGVSVTGNTITKTAASGWGNAGAASVNQLAAGASGWMETTYVVGGAERVVGLSDVNVDANFTSIDYAFYIGNTLLIYENGVNKGVALSAPVVGELLRVERNGTTINYKRNGTIVYTSLVPSTTSLVADAAINQTSFTVSNANASFVGSYPVTWIDPQNITVNADNSLTRTGAAAWNSGANSLNKLNPNQDGWVEFTIPTTGIYMAGLSGYNLEATYNSINYSFYIAGNALYVYETGSQSGPFGTVIPGMVLRISREGTSIKYYVNGVVIRTTAVAAAKPLRVDVAINSGSSPAMTTSFDKQLAVSPVFTFPTLANNNGGISLNVSGGYAPISYTWSSGETTNAVAGKARGTYTSTIADANGRSSVNSYSLGYPVGWVDRVGVIVNADNTITKNSGTLLWDAGASSSNSLAASTDGWMEFITGKAGSVIMAGLTVTDLRKNYNDINYAFSLDAIGNIQVFENGTNIGIFGYTSEGDVLRIAREANTIKYYINGIVVRSVVNVTNPLVVDAAIYNAGTVPQINTSFDRKMIVRPTYTYPVEATNTGGGIALNADGGHPPYTILWSTSETTDAISNKARGLYTVNVTDSYGRTFAGTYNLGYKVSWTDLRNVTLNANSTLTKVLSTGWDGSAISGNILPANADGWVEFIVNDLDVTDMFGLARFNVDPSYTAIDYAFYLSAGGYLAIRELGNNIINYGYISKGDLLRLERNAGQVKYYQNGALIRSVAANTSALHVDFSINGAGTTPTVASASFGQAPQQVYYSISSGNWNTPATWSLTEGGSAGTLFPLTNDVVYVKGYTVTVTGTSIYCSNVNIVATNATTALKIDGTNACVTVKGEIKVSGQGNTDPTKALVVQNEGKVVCN